MADPILKTKNRFIEFYQHHEVLVSLITFALGFLFDVLTIRRIDNINFIIQQGIYLGVLGVFLILEIRHKVGMRGLWKYHNLVVHFLFGALLSIYTIFFYTSASALTSFIYILLLAGLMLANEFSKVRAVGISVRVTLYTICSLSFFSFLYPIIYGRVGVLPFWLGVGSSLSLFTFIWLMNLRSVLNIKKEVVAPALVVHLLFILGYYTSLIPPVPVAVKKIGVYYDVIKEERYYIGLHDRTYWESWKPGTKTLKVREGDKVTILLSIFSPAHFQDQVYLKWYYDDENKGLTLEDTIPLEIKGGREQGFRGYASKQFYKLGHYRVIVETSDGREVGRISVLIERDKDLQERTFKKDRF